MVGNHTEWVNDWMVTGPSWQMSDEPCVTDPWVVSGDATWYVDDLTWNVNGQSTGAMSGGQAVPGLPAAAIRGFRRRSFGGAGLFHLALNFSGEPATLALGARCCKLR